MTEPPGRVITLVPSALVPGAMVGETWEDDRAVKEMMPWTVRRPKSSEAEVFSSGLSTLVARCSARDVALLLRCDLGPGGMPREVG